MPKPIRAGNLASAPKRPSAIAVLHQQAQQAASGAGAVLGGYIGEPAATPERNESEVSREVSNLTHNIDELHLALGRLEEQLSPVLAVFPPMPSDNSAVPATDSPLGGVLQGQAQNVHQAISRVHALMNAIRI